MCVITSAEVETALRNQIEELHERLDELNKDNEIVNELLADAYELIRMYQNDEV